MTLLQGNLLIPIVAYIRQILRNETAGVAIRR